MDFNVRGGQAAAMGPSGMGPAGMIGTPAAASAIGEDQIRQAHELLDRYRMGKTALDARIVDEERWYQMQHDRQRQEDFIISSCKDGRRPDDHVLDRMMMSRSGWLFQAIWSKHNDAMDNVPEPHALPREESDKASAELLSDILPCITQRSNFRREYSLNEWCKLKHGLCAWGIFWDPSLDNGLGDISIKKVDLLKLYWAPGITDIQDSPALFIVDMVDYKLLKSQYPQMEQARRRASGSGASWPGERYPQEDAHDLTETVLVVDWYYKVYVGGRKVTHYCKFADGVVLYASEDDPAYAETGWYAHGLYPIVMDVLYPFEDSITGFGMIALCRSPQSYIEYIDQRLAEYADWASRVRFWAKRSMGINEQDFVNLDKRIVEVEGQVDDERLRQITIGAIDPHIINLRDAKIAELKEVSGARDVNQGSSTGGVTAAAAIAALQEAGSKGSRDEIGSAYNAMELVMQQVVELMRQFYTEERSFRILLPNGQRQDGMYAYRRFSGGMIAEQPTGMGASGEVLYRKPIFDIEIVAAKMSPYSQLSQNQTMMSLFEMGALNPEAAQQALTMLAGMDFPGIDEVREDVQRGATLMDQLQICITLICQLTGRTPEEVMAVLQMQSGAPVGGGGVSPAADAIRTLTAAQEGAADVKTTPYIQQMQQRAQVSADRPGQEATPR